jgi:hypothetical protein
MGWGIARPTQSIASGGGGRLHAGPRPLLQSLDEVCCLTVGAALPALGIAAHIERIRCEYTNRRDADAL